MIFIVNRIRHVQKVIFKVTLKEKAHYGVSSNLIPLSNLNKRSQAQEDQKLTNQLIKSAKIVKKVCWKIDITDLN